MRRLNSGALLLCFAFVAFSGGGCVHKGSHALNEDRVSVMTFNVENLFDTEREPGKLDITFLPLEKKSDPEVQALCQKMTRQSWVEECLTLDWNDQVLEEKMEALARAILQVQNGKGPDVLLVQEVENVEVLRTLNKRFLKAAGYREVVLLEGKDARGIDVGVLSRLPLKGTPVLHRISYEEEGIQRDSRPILEVPLELPDGNTLRVLNAHFPAPFHPWKARERALEVLSGVQSSFGKKDVVVAGGDFNIPSSEEAERGLLKSLSGQWSIAHFEGCRQCLGTAYYPPERTWSFLDVLMVRKGEGVSWSLDAESVKVPQRARTQVDRHGRPQRFDPKTFEGVSDHLPVYIEIILGS